MSIDFNFEFSAPHFVDFAKLKDGGEPDDSWFDKYEDDEGSRAENDFQVQASTPAKNAVKKAALTKPHTPKLHTAVRNVLRAPPLSTQKPMRVQPTRLSKGGMPMQAPPVKKPAPKALPKLTVPQPVVLHSQQRADIRNAMAQSVSASEPASVSVDNAPRVHKAPQGKPKPTVQKPFTFQSDARSALKKLAKPAEVDTTQPRGLTSPVAAKVRPNRPLPKLTVPHSPQLATAVRRQLREFSAPPPTPTPKKVVVSKPAQPRAQPLKRGPTIQAPFHLASESRAAIRAMHQEPHAPAPTSRPEPTPAKPKRVHQIVTQPKLTIPISPKLSTRTRAKVRTQVQASIREELSLKKTPVKEPQKVIRRQTQPVTSRPRQTTVPKPFHLSTASQMTHRGLRKLSNEGVKVPKVLKAPATVTKPQNVASKVSRESLSAFKPAKEPARRGPTIPQPFQLESEKRHNAYEASKRLASAQALAEQNSILRTPRTAVKRPREDDGPSVDEPLSKKLKTPFVARTVPTSLYQADFSVKTNKRMADLTKSHKKALPATDKKPMSALTRLQERRKTAAPRAKLNL